MVFISSTAPDGDLSQWIDDLLAADHACYSAPADRVDRARLEKVVTAFPQGFRLWRLDDAPVAYSGWYPVSEDIFMTLHENPQTLTGRGAIMPQSGAPYLYIFNYSLIAPLHKSDQSRALLRALADDIAAQNAKGLAAVTVSEDGARIAKRFGMERRGAMTHDSVFEDVYTKLS